MKTLLWLDDIRNPRENNWAERYSPISEFNVVWVKSYYEFVNYIMANGMPDAICFDHDLADISDEHDEKTGYDAAKYVVDYCIDHNRDIPLFNVQSDNGAGSENITCLLNNYHRFSNS